MKRVSFVLAILFFVACKKETDIAEETYRKFNTVEYACGVQITFKANYDGDKLISLIGQVFSVNYYYIYNSQGQVIQRDFENAGLRQKVTEYRYDNAGQLVEKKELAPVCFGRTSYMKYNYGYENGKLTQATSYLKDNSTGDYIFFERKVYGWTGENIRTVTLYNINNAPFPELFDISYDLTKPNPMLIFKDFWLLDLWDYPSTTHFLLSKNLMTSMRTPTGDCSVIYTYDSTFNEKRIKTLRTTCFNADMWNFTYSQ